MCRAVKTIHCLGSAPTIEVCTDGTACDICGTMPFFKRGQWSSVHCDAPIAGNQVTCDALKSTQFLSDLLGRNIRPIEIQLCMVVDMHMVKFKCFSILRLWRKIE